MPEHLLRHERLFQVTKKTTFTEQYRPAHKTNRPDRNNLTKNSISHNICCSSAPITSYSERKCDQKNSNFTEHLLQFSPLNEPLRKRIWQDYMPGAFKLYSSPKELQHTATFIKETGASMVHLVNVKRKKF